MLNWRRDPDVERRIADEKRRSLESEKRTKQLESEIDLLDEKLRNFKDLELRLKQAASSSPTPLPPPQPSEPSSSKPWSGWLACDEEQGVAACGQLREMQESPGILICRNM